MNSKLYTQIWVGNKLHSLSFTHWSISNSQFRVKLECRLKSMWWQRHFAGVDGARRINRPTRHLRMSVLSSSTSDGAISGAIFNTNQEMFRVVSENKISGTKLEREKRGRTIFKERGEGLVLRNEFVQHIALFSYNYHSSCSWLRGVRAWRWEKYFPGMGV